VLNIAVRFVFRWRADAHERRYHRADDGQPEEETPAKENSRKPLATEEKDAYVDGVQQTGDESGSVDDEADKD
jgi:hypothetical protein